MIYYSLYRPAVTMISLVSGEQDLRVVLNPFKVKNQFTADQGRNILIADSRNSRHLRKSFGIAFGCSILAAVYDESLDI